MYAAGTLLFKTYETQTLGRKEWLNDTENLHLTPGGKEMHVLCLLQGDTGEDCVQMSLGMSSLQVVTVTGERC